ncbi:unnamed protein product, partial [Iphiclides podalirius]
MGRLVRTPGARALRRIGTVATGWQQQVRVKVARGADGVTSPAGPADRPTLRFDALHFSRTPPPAASATVCRLVATRSPAKARPA